MSPVEKFLTGDSWGLSIVLLLGLALFGGMVWIAVHSDRFKLMIGEDEGFFDDDLDE